MGKYFYTIAKIFFPVNIYHLRETLPAAGLSSCLAELVLSLLSCGCGCGVRGMTEGMEEAAAEGGRSDRSEEGDGERESSGLKPGVDKLA